MTINLEVDMLHFVFIYELLKNNLENDPFKSAILREAYDYVSNELTEQYTVSHGEYLEKINIIKKSKLK